MSDKPSFILEGYNPDKTYFQQKKFDCGNEIINRFVASGLKKQVRSNLSCVIHRHPFNIMEYGI